MFLFQQSLDPLLGLPLWIWYIFIFAVGAIIGSFLNVVIHRVPREESVVFPNSACPKCKEKIGSIDNIPIISWLVLRGKCRKCSNPIAWRYPAVEALTGVIFVLVFWSTGFSILLPINLIFAAIMISLVFIDAEHMILPNVITYPLFAAVIILRLVLPLVSSLEKPFSDMSHGPLVSLDYPAWAVSLIGGVLGAAMGGGSLWLVGEIWKRLRGVDAMGLGDVKMMFGVGALLGWRLTLLTIFLAAFTGAVAGMLVIAKSEDKNMQAQIPFGIFLGIGAIIALLFGDQMISWYTNTFIPA